jgi:hypothetical protein
MTSQVLHPHHRTILIKLPKQKFVRIIEVDRSSVSLREVSRCAELFEWFYYFFVQREEQQKLEDAQEDLDTYKSFYDIGKKKTGNWIWEKDECEWYGCAIITVSCYREYIFRNQMRKVYHSLTCYVLLLQT